MKHIEPYMEITREQLNQGYFICEETTKSLQEGAAISPDNMVTYRRGEYHVYYRTGRGTFIVKNPEYK
jgi:hypothetical protein